MQDADIPKQGNALLRHVASCELRGEELDSGFLSSAASAIDDWMGLQVELQQVAASLLKTLDAMATDEGDDFPVWRMQRWSQPLMMPWSEDLGASILLAFSYINENA